MRSFKYILELEGLEDYGVGELVKQVLGIVAEFGPISPYSIKKIIEENGRKVNYKNVHQSVKKLEALGLASLSSRGKDGHAATNYVLTTKGWGFLISDAEFFFYLPTSSIKAKYADGSLIRRSQFPKPFLESSIFRELIEPYFEKSTLAAISDEVYSALLVYLRECVETIKKHKEFNSEYIVEGSLTASILRDIAETKLLTIAQINLVDTSLCEEDELKFRQFLLSDNKFHEQMKRIRARLNEIFVHYEEMYKPK